jgi:hypothetical protein
MILERTERRARKRDARLEAVATGHRLWGIRGLIRERLVSVPCGPGAKAFMRQILRRAIVGFPSVA